MIDEDYYALELVKAVAKLIEAEDFPSVERSFSQVIDRAQQLTREKYAALAKQRGDAAKSELHDEGVQAQGGL